MEVYGEGGVLVSLVGLMGWVYGRTLGRVGESFVVTPYLMWEMVPRLDFGMIVNVGDMALKEAFLVLFGIDHAKDATVGALMDFFEGAIRWNVSFARAAQD
jgi:hypothetical protein